ncbi:fatty acid desaturase [Crocosphaera sp. XPORK-15E]|uniref:fatty acid desaturase n=1 Tax=Crocosphaera sp. XPORK-15E TaxID=3110247 RepID=UPI002B1F05DE|nr:fatty acid desaturase [Crocosphaera sp. XPORK-15E]MEA5535360.1 fatty acid desaturase [Crocosphaera sp. XPORK-15E]
MVLQKNKSYLGLWLAIAILLLWLSSGLFLMAFPLSQMSWIAIAILVGCRSFLHTGLFILAHDAIHGNLVPHNLLLNQKIGQITVLLYAYLSYENCQNNHKNHHLNPAHIGDPDFHDGVHCHPILWYYKFLCNYFSVAQFIKFLGVIALLSLFFHTLFDVAYLNLLLFFLIPLVLSSLQLFFFGTYLPHGKATSWPNRTHPTHFLGNCWSLLTCYHFGSYHEEHHAFPQIPWFQLPQAIFISQSHQKLL